MGNLRITFRMIFAKIYAETQPHVQFCKGAGGSHEPDGTLTAAGVPVDAPRSRSTRLQEPQLREVCGHQYPSPRHQGREDQRVLSRGEPLGNHIC